MLTSTRSNSARHQSVVGQLGQRRVMVRRQRKIEVDLSGHNVNGSQPPSAPMASRRVLPSVVTNVVDRSVATT